jgi:hypothetical protein
MSINPRDQLAEIHAKLLHDRATFEQRVSGVLDQLTREKLQLGEEWRRLLAARQRFVLLGRRLRRRWRSQHVEQTEEIGRNAALVASKSQRLTTAVSKLQDEQVRLNDLRGKLAKDAKLLEKERAELIAYRSRFEAERLGWEEQQQRRLDDAQALERRIEDLQGELLDLRAKRDARSRAGVFEGSGRQKVA